MSGALGGNLRPAKHTGGRVGSSIHRDHKAPEVKKNTVQFNGELLQWLRVGDTPSCVQVPPKGNTTAPSPACASHQMMSAVARTGSAACFEHPPEPA